LRPLDGYKLVTELTDLGVEDKTFEINVGETSNSETRSIVAATAFESNPSVLDTVEL
jgi:hypothetical protein